MYPTPMAIPPYMIRSGLTTMMPVPAPKPPINKSVAIMIGMCIEDYCLRGKFVLAMFGSRALK